MSVCSCASAFLIVAGLGLPFAGHSWAAETPSRFSVEVEAGAFWTSRNEAAIPGDTGTRFSVLDLTGNGPEGYFRANLTYNFNPRHQLRLTAAPLGSEGTGLLSAPVNFDGVTFGAGVPTRAEYRFNTWRLTYRWTFVDDERWQLGVGGVALVRDARIALTQGALSAADDNIGFVPLLHFYARCTIAPGTYAALDFEGLAAPQGRALDGSARLVHEFSPRWSATVGYRTLEGGVDNDNAYNFAWFHFVFAAVRCSF